MQSTKIATFWARWKFKLIAGVAILVALAIAIFAAHTVGFNKGKNLSAIEISRYEKDLRQKRVKVVEAQGKVDIRVVTKYIKQIEFKDRIVYRNRDIIRTVVTTRPAEQIVSKGWVYSHNQSVLTQPIDPSKAADSAASGIPDNQVLDRVAENYSIGNKAIAQLEALQQWIRESEKARNEALKK